MKTKLFGLLVLGLLTGTTYAQDMLALTYSTAASTGKLNDYVSKYSFRGMALDYRTGLKDKLIYGFSTSWNVFYEEKEYDSYTFETVTATGRQFRYTNAFPMMGNIDYADKKGNVEWFAGLGIGTTYLMRETDFGSYAWITNTWQFLVAPEVGFAYPLVDGNNIFASIRYHQNVKSKDLDGQSYLSVNLGFGFGRLTNKY